MPAVLDAPQVSNSPGVTATSCTPERANAPKRQPLLGQIYGFAPFTGFSFAPPPPHAESCRNFVLTPIQTGKQQDDGGLKGFHSVI